MGNEAKTENIVRDALKVKGYYNTDEIIVEEKKSDSPAIQKLLSHASKKGLGGGYPEFIIRPTSSSEFIIVVECKADTAKHASLTGDKYADYAVDGAMLYSSFLSKVYDVLAIAVSGENSGNLRISHYLFLKNGVKPIPAFGDKILGFTDYFEGYKKSPEKFKQDYDSLMAFSRVLNQELHSNKILESQRGLLISSILIALENKAFRKSYKDHDKPENLANALVDTVVNELKRANLHPKKLENLSVQFSFIRTDTTLSGQKNVLSTLIDDIDSNINHFIKTHEYYDVLGQLYIEFLRYANSDKSLGIVLTPPHITELFCALAGVNKNTVVYDNCTGTGGFLISAMREMVRDAKGDLTKIKSIKEKQLVGVEYQSHIFALACSNMFIHQDGKTNIINGDCFDIEIMEQVKKFKPTVGLLNPPYQVDRKKDRYELEFILNNLQVLEPRGVCVAIVPMERLMATSGVKYDLKRQLLQEHTLEAVMSMPDQLFNNSDTGSITAVIVVTAHKPHPPNKETYLGYWKNDGFIKRKNKGRIDYYGHWSSIRTEWLNSFVNRKTEPGLSVNRVVTAKDEWVAEAYLETDYSKLKLDDFAHDVRKYALFKTLELGE